MQKNKYIRNTDIVLSNDSLSATISAREIDFGYDENLLTLQAFSVGRSNNMLSNMSLMLQAYLNGLELTPAYHYKEDKLNKLLAPLQKKIDVKPIDALFNFQGGKVTAFKLSSDGKAIDKDKLKLQVKAAQSERDHIGILLLEYLDDPCRSIRQRAVDTRKITMWNLVHKLLSAFEHSDNYNLYQNPLWNTTFLAAVI